MSFPAFAPKSPKSANASKFPLITPAGQAFDAGSGYQSFQSGAGVPPFVNVPERGRDTFPVVISGLIVNTGEQGGLPIASLYTPAYDGVDFPYPIWILSQPPSLSNVMEQLTLNANVERQEINALNTTFRNEFVLSDGIECTFRIYRVNTGYDPDPLQTTWANYDYMMAQWSQGTAVGATANYSLIFVRGNLQKPTEGRGKQVTTLSGGPVDTGTGNQPGAYFPWNVFWT